MSLKVLFGVKPFGRALLPTCLFALASATSCAEVGPDGEPLETDGEVEGTSQAIEANSSVVISQLYVDISGSSGNSVTQPYNRDFIEIFNRGNHAVSLNGWSIQYASAVGTGLFGGSNNLITPLPNVSLQAGQYMLIQGTFGPGSSTTPLPSPFVADPDQAIDMARAGGKVALAKIATSVGCNGGSASSTPCTAAQLANIVDVVGYGSANYYEGALGTAAVPNGSALWRSFDGCWDTNSSSVDWVVQAPAPRTTATPVHNCGLSGTTP
ncbi:MAG: lamin tail domain-containing protein [Myxococcales bacterium]